MNHKNPNRAVDAIVFVVCLLIGAVLIVEASYNIGRIHCEISK